ncbi:N-6 DNA methylase [Flavobacteriaceae bacterium]|nr:N-6 DNA methylase [Flavobacteriaceae bacterium]
MFQNTIIKKYISSQNKDSQLVKWDLFKKFFHGKERQNSIRELKEEEYQEGFMRDLFVGVLGYILKPSDNYNLVLEKKNVKDSKKADSAIIFNDKVVSVIELKGTNTTDLGKVEVQAFSYKNNQPNCKYVITSNFEKLRFYIEDAIDFIEFNLFELTQDEFNLMYLCLSTNSIENDLPLKLKSESISQEDLITKKLYKDYSLFKRELYQNLIVLNQGYDKLVLFKKSQKLLDRFLFLFFAEDKFLLPPNSVRLILDDWEDLIEKDVEVPLYNRFKKYFGYLNTGFKGKRYDVFPYNGGLFKSDEILDNILIDDKLLFLHTKKLSEYDFESEVDVNILGHIFENSLNEIEEISNELKNGEVDKTNTKRKKDGVFYTPKYITKYIVDNTIGKLCNEKKIELQINDEDYTTDKKRIKKTIKNLSDKLTEYRNWLLQLTICDPACGSGAFLNQSLDFLILEHQYIDELQSKLFGDSLVLSDIENSILENNIFGVDINEESVEIAKLSLWLRTAQPNRKLNNLNSNIKCGNSLVDNVEVDNHFNWKNEFPQVFDKGGFDVIIGNPPYVKEYTNKSSFDNLHEHPIYQGKMDLWYFFGWLGLELIKKDFGLIGYIAPTNWITNFGASKFRNYFLEKGELVDYVDFGDFKVFEDAGIQTMIYIMKSSTENDNYNFPYSELIEKKSSTSDVKLFLNKSKNQKFEFFNSTINKNEFYDSYIQFNRKEIIDLSNRIKEEGEIKLTKNEIAQGIVPPQDFINKKSLSILGEGFSLGDGIFNLTQNEYDNLNIPINEKELIKPFFTSFELNKYVGNKSNKLWIIYTSSKFKVESEIEKFPTIKNHLDKFKSVITSDNKPYGLHRSRDERFFNNEKILSLRKCIKPTFTFTDFPTYVSQSYNIIKTERVNLKFLTCLLNSKLIEFWLKYNGKMQGSIFQVDKEPLLDIPIKTPTNSDLYENLFDEISTSIIELNKLKTNSIKSIYSRLSISNKIKQIEEFDYKDYEGFISVLKKNKQSIPPITEDIEWREFITNLLIKNNTLEFEIKEIEDKIDNEILKLYSIDREELEL